MASILCFGYTTSARADVLAKLPPPKVPRNYKKADVIAEYIDKAKAELETRAASAPFLAQLEEVCFVDGNGRLISRHFGGDVAGRLLHHVLVDEPGPALVGFGVRRLFEIAVAESMSRQKCVWSCGGGLLGPLAERIVDLGDALVPSWGHILTPEVLLRAVNLAAPPDDATPEQWALAALDLAVRCGVA